MQIRLAKLVNRMLQKGKMVGLFLMLGMTNAVIAGQSQLSTSPNTLPPPPGPYQAQQSSQSMPSAVRSKPMVQRPMQMPTPAYRTPPVYPGYYPYYPYYPAPVYRPYPY